MNRTRRHISIRAASVLAAFSGLAASPTLAQPVTTVFTYQGELRSAGTVQNGAFDMRFSLFDASASGSQVGTTLCIDNVQVVDGKFTVQLDFGAQFTGSQRFLDLQVRADTGLGCANTAGFTTLTPRQSLTASPNALWAGSANAANNALALGGQTPSFFQNASNLTSGTIADGRLSSNVAVRNAPNTFTSSVTAASFSGSGAGLTGLSASNVSSGTLDDARLSSNVALRNAPNTFTMSNIFSTPVRIGTNTTVSTSSGLTVRGPTAGAAFSGMYVDSQDVVGKPFYGFATNGVFRAWTQFDGATNEWSLINEPAAGPSTPIMKCNAAGNMIFTRDVGINTGATTPGARLHVQGTLAGTDIFAGDRAPTGEGSLVLNNSTTVSGRADVLVYNDDTLNMYVNPGGYGAIRNEWAVGNNHKLRAAGTQNGGYPEISMDAGSEPAGISLEADMFSIINLDNNFRLSTRNNAFARGGAVRIDARPGLPLFQFWHRGVFGSGENLCASLDHLGNFTSAGSVTGTGTGVLFGAGGVFTCAATIGDGLYAASTATTGASYGVNGASASVDGVGVNGQAFATSGANYGVYGGTSSLASGFGVYSGGRFGASGTKSFRIDHPADPENKYLQHYCAESPEVLNFYRGTVVLDDAGEAVVTLPSYFALINTDPTYTLTAVGAPMPMLHVLSEIDPGTLGAGMNAKPGDKVPQCSFIIGGGVAGSKVSWRVEAVRNDAWVRAYGAPVEVEKQGVERGAYQHPELFGQPEERAMRRREQAATPAPEAPSTLTRTREAKPTVGGF